MVVADAPLSENLVVAHMDLHTRFPVTVTKGDPQAIIGFEGAGEFDRETDPELICRELGFWAPYGGHADELIRSIAPRSFSRGNWMGYHQTADGHGLSGVSGCQVDVRGCTARHC